MKSPLSWACYLLSAAALGCAATGASILVHEGRVLAPALGPWACAALWALALASCLGMALDGAREAAAREADREALRLEHVALLDRLARGIERLSEEPPVPTHLRATVLREAGERGAA